MWSIYPEIRTEALSSKLHHPRGEIKSLDLTARWQRILNQSTYSTLFGRSHV